jgi:hypothetical protein
MFRNSTQQCFHLCRCSTYKKMQTRTILSQNTPVTKALVRDVGSNLDMNINDMFQMGNIRTLSGYFIISSDLNLENINLNYYMCHTCSHDSYHLCYNPSINDD